MYKANIYFAHWIRELYFPVEVDIHNVFVKNEINPNRFNVLNISNEPEITRMSNVEVIKIADKFDLILTWDENLLHLPNAKLFFNGSTWIKKEHSEKINMTNKSFIITTLCGSKNLTYNHRLRHELWSREGEFKVPTLFFNSAHNSMRSNPSRRIHITIGVNPEDKVYMFGYAQYHIAIENVCEANNFSEKLMDCFQTFTIPIYIGAPNIGSFFNTKGMIICDSVSDLINKCNNWLDPMYYFSKLEFIRENYLLSKPYCRDFTDRIKRAIEEVVGEKG